MTDGHTCRCRQRESPNSWSARSWACPTPACSSGAWHVPSSSWVSTSRCECFVGPGPLRRSLRGRCYFEWPRCPTPVLASAARLRECCTAEAQKSPHVSTRPARSTRKPGDSPPEWARRHCCPAGTFRAVDMLDAAKLLAASPPMLGGLFSQCHHLLHAVGRPPTRPLLASGAVAALVFRTSMPVASAPGEVRWALSGESMMPSCCYVAAVR